MGVVEIAADDLFERLSDYDYQRAYRWRRNRKLEHTTTWILKQSDVLAWLRGEGPQCLWLSGIGKLRLPVCFRFDQGLISCMAVGCGKSIIVYSHIPQSHSSSMHIANVR
jgi:hypothetical protein